MGQPAHVVRVAGSKQVAMDAFVVVGVAVPAP